MQSKVVTFTKPTSTTGNQSVTGVGFRPRAIILTGSDGTNITRAGLSLGFGCDRSASGSLLQRSFNATNDDGANPTDCHRRYTEDHIISYDDGAGAVGSSAILVSVDEDGFTVNWDVCDALTSQIWAALCIGGEDIEEVHVGTWTLDTGAADQDITDPNFQPDAILFASTSNVGTGHEDGASINIMAFAHAGTQWGNAIHCNDNDTPTNTDSRFAQQTISAFLTFNALDVGTPPAVVGAGRVDSMSNWPQGGFRMTYPFGAPTNAIKAGYIAIKGGRWYCDRVATGTSTGDVSTTVPGFFPRAFFLSMMGQNTATVGTNAAVQQCYGVSSVDVDASAALTWTLGAFGTEETWPASDQLDSFRIHSIIGDATMEGDIKTADPEGFTFTLDVTSGVSRYLYYWCGGDGPAADRGPQEPWGANQG